MIDAAALKRDKPFNRAAIVGYVLAIGLTVAVGAIMLPDTGWIERRGTGPYWLSMAPALVWIVGLASFSRWAVALLPVVLGGTPVLLAGLALTRSPMGGAEGQAYWAATALSAFTAWLGFRFLRQSCFWAKA